MMKAENKGTYMGYTNIKTMHRLSYMINALLICLVLLMTSCEKELWKEHYEEYDERLDMEIWSAIAQEAEYSSFVNWVEENNMDTIFDAEVSHTLFIPTNSAIAAFSDTTGYSIEKIIQYHIVPTMVQTNSINSPRKVQTLSGKFVIVERVGDLVYFDEHSITRRSPLYLDGCYYELSKVASPRPNLYEYTSLYSKIITEYIDRSDSIFLDKSLSEPIGFDDWGNTIYDSVFTTVNRFNRDFFPVSEEFRDEAATFLLFTQEQYNTALDEMAEKLGSTYLSREDLPEQWQFEILMPSIIQNSLFDGKLNYSDFRDTMVNIAGDTVYLDPFNIDPFSEFICSNGKVFTFQNFSIPEELYRGSHVIEGEDMIDSIGLSKFAWKDFIKVSGIVEEPLKLYSDAASEGAFVSVPFPRNYSGDFAFEFSFDNLFPMKYRLVWGASYRPSGNYSIYVNDMLIAEYDTYNLRSSNVSVTGEFNFPVNGINQKDWWVENIQEFGKVTVRFEYTEPGVQAANGFNIDFVALIPATNE